MARIKPSAIISDIRGSVQGSIFQQSIGGLVLKAKQSKVNPQTFAQQATRGIMDSLQYQWKQLSDSQRLLWTRFAGFTKIQQRNSTAFYVNGQQAFLKINAIRLQYSLSLLTAPQFNKCQIAPITMALSLSGGNLTLTSNRFVDASYEMLVLFATLPVSEGINNAGSRFRIIPFATVNGTIFNINASYLAKMNYQPVASDIIFIRFTLMALASGVQLPRQTVRASL